MPDKCDLVRLHPNRLRQTLLNVNATVPSNDPGGFTVIGNGELVFYGYHYGHENMAVVSRVKVDEEYRRCRIGTRIYEEFLKAACSDGYRMSSDVYRTEQSEKFWRKQKEKGRAKCVRQGKIGGVKLNEKFDRIGKWPCHHYEMKETCPRDMSLKGRRKNGK